MSASEKLKEENMSTRVNKAKEALLPQARVAGRIVAEQGEMLTVRMGGYLLEIPRESILSQEKDTGDTVIITLKANAEILMTTVAPVEEMIGVLSSRIVKGMVNPLNECCDCAECSYCTDCTECSYCTDCTECSYCTDARSWAMRALGTLGQRRLARFKQTRRG